MVTSILTALGLCIATVAFQRTFLGDLPIVFTPAFCAVLVAAWFTNGWIAGIASLVAALLINSWLLGPSEPGSEMACLVFLLIATGFVALVRWVNRRFRNLQAELDQRLSRLHESSERNDSLRSDLERLASELHSTRRSLQEYSLQCSKQNLCLHSAETMLDETRNFLEQLPIPVVGVRVDDGVRAVHQANRAFLNLCQRPESDSPAVLGGYGNFTDLNGLPLNEALDPISRIGRGEKITAEMMRFQLKGTSILVLLWGTRVIPTGEVAIAAIPVAEIMPSQ